MNQEISVVEKINGEINVQLSNEAVSRALVATTFKGFTAPLMKQALLEGMIRGFTFKEFLEKDVYALPYGTGYSLVTSIDYTRKIAMRSGLAGKSAPIFTYDPDGNIESCSVTVKKIVNGTTGEYTATVFFKEYTSRKNLWASKPHTMISKVAEMHALRMAFPEETAKSYIEEELEKDKPALDHMLDKDGPATIKAPHTPTPAEHTLVSEDEPDEDTRRQLEEAIIEA